MGNIPREIIDQVLERADIVEVIGEYLALKPAGRNFKGLSPFKSEKTPSFIVSPDKQIFHCFSTGIGGNVLSFIMKMEGVSFPEAVRLLAQKVNVSIPESSYVKSDQNNFFDGLRQIHQLAVDYYHQYLLTDKSKATQTARDYLKNRDLTLETLQSAKIGYASEKWDGLLKVLQQHKFTEEQLLKSGLILKSQKKQTLFDRFRQRVMFPIFDIKGQCIAFGGRTLDPNESAKYLNSPETSLYSKSKNLYGLNWAKSEVIKQDKVVIVEGYMDWVMPWQFGFYPICASLGTALTTEQIKLLKRYTKNVIFLYDMDSSGLAAMTRSLPLLMNEEMNVSIAQLEEGDDPDSFIRREGLEQFNERITSGFSIYQFNKQQLERQYDPQTAEGKTQIIKGLLALLKNLTNDLYRENFLLQIQEDFRVQRMLLEKELEQPQKSSSYNSPSKQQVKKNVVVHNKLNKLEVSLFDFLVHHPHELGGVLEQLSPEDFEDQRIPQLLLEMMKRIQKGDKITVSSLIAGFNQEEIADIVQWVMTDHPYRGSKQVLPDYIQNMRARSKERKQKQLKEKMQAAEMSGDEATRENLMRELNELIKKN